MNTVILIGNLTRDPEVVTLAGDEIETHVRLAVDRPSGRDGARADFLTVVCSGHQARLARDYLHKGRLVAVDARLRSNDHTGALEVVARRIKYLDAGSRRRVSGRVRGS